MLEWNTVAKFERFIDLGALLRASQSVDQVVIALLTGNIDFRAQRIIDYIIVRAKRGSQLDARPLVTQYVH